MAVVERERTITELDEIHGLEVGVRCGVPHDGYNELPVVEVTVEGIFVFRFNNQLCGHASDDDFA